MTLRTFAFGKARVELALMRILVALLTIFLRSAWVDFREALFEVRDGGGRFTLSIRLMTRCALHFVVRRSERESSCGMLFRCKRCRRSKKRLVFRAMAHRTGLALAYLLRGGDRRNEDWRVRRVVTFAACANRGSRRRHERCDRLLSAVVMALRTFEAAVASRQRKNFRVFEGGNGVECFFLTMARCAVRAKRALVNVVMTCSTCLQKSEITLLAVLQCLRARKEMAFHASQRFVCA